MFNDQLIPLWNMESSYILVESLTLGRPNLNVYEYVKRLVYFIVMCYSVQMEYLHHMLASKLSYLF